MLQVPLWFEISVVRAWSRLSQLGLILSLAFIWGLCWSSPYSNRCVCSHNQQEAGQPFCLHFVMKFREAGFSKTNNKKNPENATVPKQTNINTHVKNTCGEKKGKGFEEIVGTTSLFICCCLDPWVPFLDLPNVTGFWMTTMKFNQDYIL